MTDDTPRTTREDATVLVDFCRKVSGFPAVYGEESLGYLDVLLTDYLALLDELEQLRETLQLMLETAEKLRWDHHSLPAEEWFLAADTARAALAADDTGEGAT